MGRSEITRLAATLHSVPYCLGSLVILQIPEVHSPQGNPEAGGLQGPILRNIHRLKGQVEEKVCQVKETGWSTHRVSGEWELSVPLAEAQQNGLLVEKQKLAGNGTLATSQTVTALLTGNCSCCLYPSTLMLLCGQEWNLAIAM